MSTEQKPAPPSKALAKVEWDKPTDKNGLEKLGGMVLEQIEKALPRTMQGSGKKMVRALIMTATKAPKLMECTPLSLFGACIEAARLGLELGGPLGHAYLLPFKNSATLVIGYKGLADLAWRSGKIVGIEPGLVCRKDMFDYERGTNSFLRHKEARGNRGDVELYYIVVRTTSGTTFDLMTLEDGIDFRNRYSTVRTAPAYVRANSPWYDIDEDPNTGSGTPRNGFHWMVWKTILRRMCKLLPLSPELQTAVKIDEDSERGELQAPQESVSLLMDRPEETNGNGGESKLSDDLKKRMANATAPAAAEEPIKVIVNESDADTLSGYITKAVKTIEAADGAVDLHKTLTAVDADIAQRDPQYKAGSILDVALRSIGATAGTPVSAIAKFTDKQIATAKQSVSSYIEDFDRG